MQSAIYVGGKVLPVTLDRDEQGGYVASADVRVGPAMRLLFGTGETYDAALGSLRRNIIRAHEEAAASR